LKHHLLYEYAHDYLNSTWYELPLLRTLNQHDKATTADRGKECKDVTSKPLEIRVIWAVFFISLAGKQDYKIFAIIIKDIKKVLKPKQYINP